MSTPFFVPSFCFKSMLGTLAFLTCMSCTSSQTNPSSGFIGENVDFARTQLGLAIDTIEASGKCLNPVTLNKDGKVYYCGYADWRSGFFPGSIWYLYELTGDSAYLPLARKYTEAIRKAENLTWHHDIGFIVNCSFGNGLRLSRYRLRKCYGAGCPLAFHPLPPQCTGHTKLGCERKQLAKRTRLGMSGNH